MSENVAWDQYDQLDITEAWVDRICAFISPEGMKAMRNAREHGGDEIRPEDRQPTEVSPEVIESVRQSERRPKILDEPLDEIEHPEIEEDSAGSRT